MRRPTTGCVPLPLRRRTGQGRRLRLFDRKPLSRQSDTGNMLSAEQFASLLKSGTPSNEVQSGMRRAVRVPHRGQVSVTFNSARGELRQVVAFRDLSARGIGLLHRMSLGCGSTFVAHLPRETGEELTVLCTVAHCQPLPDGLFAIGAEFTCVITNSPHDMPNRGEVDRIRAAVLNAPDRDRTGCGPRS